MKIEPRKTASLPKYAAVLASAVLLTGCGYDEPVTTDGTAPAPDPAVEFMGEAQPDPAFTAVSAQTTAPEQTVTETVTTAVTEEPVMLDGDVVMLDGVTDVYDGDYVCTQPVQTCTTPAKPQLAGMIQVNPDIQPDDQAAADTASAEQKQIVSRWKKAFRARGWTTDLSEENTKWFGNGFQRIFCFDAQETAFLLYDGSAGTGITMQEWSESLSTEYFDWGCIMSLDEAGTERAIFVDISGDPAPETVFEDAGL